MKKLLIGILAVLLLVVGAVLVIPSLIDWNTYKAEIAARIGAATGRAVTLDGKASAHAEHTLAVTLEGPEILTLTKEQKRQLSKAPAESAAA